MTSTTGALEGPVVNSSCLVLKAGFPSSVKALKKVTQSVERGTIIYSTDVTHYGT